MLRMATDSVNKHETVLVHVSVFRCYSCIPASCAMRQIALTVHINHNRTIISFAHPTTSVC